MITDIFPTAFSIGDGMPVRRGKPNRVIALPAHFQSQHLPILTRSTNQSMRHIFTPTRRHWNNWGTRACYWMDLDGVLPNRENPVNLESPRHPTTIVMDGPEEKERLSDLIKSWQLTRHMRSMYPTQTTLGMELCLWGYTLAQLQRQDILHTFSQKTSSYTSTVWIGKNYQNSIIKISMQGPHGLGFNKGYKNLRQITHKKIRELQPIFFPKITHQEF